MVDASFINNTRKIRKRGAILNIFKSRSFYWPVTSSDRSRIVRVPYTLNIGFFNSFFGKRKTHHIYYIYISHTLGEVILCPLFSLNYAYLQNSSCSYSISRFPKLPLSFYISIEI